MTALRRALLAVGCIAVACASLPSVVTVTVPYTAVVLLDTLDDHSGALGRTSCDLNGQPIIALDPRLDGRIVAWVVLHEEIHVNQMRAFPGGCPAYALRYKRDSLFALWMEAQAFCGVHDAQHSAHVPSEPGIPSIIWRLRYRYDHAYTEETVRGAMRCVGQPDSTRSVSVGAVGAPSLPSRRQ